MLEHKLMMDYQRVSTVFAQIKRVAKLSESRDPTVRKIKRMIEKMEREK